MFYKKFILDYIVSQVLQFPSYRALKKKKKKGNLIVINPNTKD